MKSCTKPNFGCLTSPSEPGVHNRTSALINGRGTLPSVPLAAGIVSVGAGNALANFSIVIAAGKRVPAGIAAVWMQEHSTQFKAACLNITMHQANVSNAFKIEGAGFELADNVVAQVGECNYPNYGRVLTHTRQFLLPPRVDC